MASVLATHAPPPSRLGEILVSIGSITPAQLEQALAEQRRIKRPFGQTLLALGFVTDEAMRQALGAQLNVPYIDLDRVVLDRGLADLVDRDFAERHLLMPVARIGPTLTVAMDDPTAASVIEELARKTGLTINVVTSSALAIADAFSRAYGAPLRAAGATEPRKPVTVGLSLDWSGDLSFKSSPGMPAIELHSSTPEIASPPQALAYAVMACMAMDVVHVVKKSRQELRAMRVAFEGERAPDNPRRFVKMRLQFDITGKVETRVVARAIELSRTTYCSVWNTLRTDLPLETSFVIHE
jgi:uncharacterized OsmC-like protein